MKPCFSLGLLYAILDFRAREDSFFRQNLLPMHRGLVRRVWLISNYLFGEPQREGNLWHEVWACYGVRRRKGCLTPEFPL